MFRTILAYTLMFTMVLMAGMGVGYYVGQGAWASALLAVLAHVSVVFPPLVAAAIVESYRKIKQNGKAE